MAYVVDTNQDPNSAPTVKYVPKFGKRHIQIILIFFMLAIAIGMRLQLSVLIVAMNDNTTCPNPDIPTFQWDNKSIVLSSFYWGYLTLQLVAGSLAKIYGAKRFLIGAMTINSVACMLIPTAAIKFGSYGVMACRVLQGVSQGFFFPSVYALLGRWAPVPERSRLGSVVTTGFSFGSVVGQPVAGFLASSWLGWPAPFYLYGGFGLLWTVFWIIFGASSPADHKSISKNEREYIETSLGVQKNEDSANIPWKEISRCIPIWALAMYFIGSTFGNVALQTETPVYMNKVLGFNIQKTSIFAAASSAATVVGALIFGQLADFLINHRYLTRQTTRKVFCVFACTVASTALSILSFIPHDAKVWSIFMFVVVGVGFSAGSGGPNVNQIDLSPRYAGIIMAITNTCSAFFSFIGPLVIQFIVTDERDTSQWRLFFFTAVTLFVFSMIVFIVFGSAERQPWDSYGLNTSQGEVDEKTRKMSRKVSVISSL